MPRMEQALQRRWGTLGALRPQAPNQGPSDPGQGIDKVDTLPSKVCKSSLSGIEEVLNPVRFIRISQSEIINIYKVKRFDISIAGTIGVEFENGTKTWASRRCVKQIKNILKNR